MLEGIVLSQSSVLSLALSDSGLILFGFLLVIFGLSIGFLFFLHTSKHAYIPLLAGFIIILFLLIAIIILDLANASGSYYTFAQTRELSELLSTHRWLLIQLPVLLIGASIITLLTYKDRIGESHAKQYRHMIQISTIVSFATILLIAFESLL